MAIPKIEGSQRDFSAGELDVSMKRADDNPIMKSGARQLSNWRIRNSKSVLNRPGRSALFVANGRVDELTMSPGNTFYLLFGHNTLKVFNSAGAQVFTQGGMPWTHGVTNTTPQVVWDVYRLSIYICFPGSVPRVLTWDGVSAWSLANFAETVTGGGQKRTFFYRISPGGLTMQASALTGAITVSAFLADGVTPNSYFVAGMIGTRIRINGAQVTIDSLVSAFVANCTVNETLFDTETGTSASVTIPALFAVGDAVIGAASGAKGVVLSRTTSTLTMILTGATHFTNGETVTGPSGSAVFISFAIVAAQATNIWDEEVMNSYRGFPSSVFIDQNRLGLCNFPAVPNGIGWSATNTPTDCYVGALPTDAIFELAPGKSRVLYVLAGAESSEFVFCDNGVYYIPITATNPLKPGSVAFNLISKDGCSAVQPRIVQELILWINAGLTSVLAVTAPGAYYRPYEVRNLSALHSHLIKSPVCIAVPSTTAQFEERYAYVLNSDGSIAVGKYDIESGQIKGMVGWLPWSTAAAVDWISAFGSDVLFSSAYSPNGIAPVNIIEKLDATQYLDGAMAVNAAPAAFAPPGGKGPLWWFAGGSVDLMDNSTRMMGTYIIDANGFIVPQNNGGENLASAQLVAGQTWTATLEPFVPDAPPGQAIGQRMFKRRVTRMAVYAFNSTGFLLARLFSGPLSPTSPALGTIMNTRRISTWNQDDDPTQAPPLREEVQRWRPLGRAYDPRVAVIKDTPGPLEIPEIGIEASI